MSIINLELITGDALKIPSDFTIIGHNNPLIPIIEEKAGGSFQKGQIQPFAFSLNYKIVQNQKSFLWKNTASIVFRSDNKVLASRFSKIESLFSLAIHKYAAENILILPLSWRNPLFCASGILYALWWRKYRSLTSSFGEKVVFGDFGEQKVTIASLDGVASFKQCLQNDYLFLWEVIRTIYWKNERHFPLGYEYVLRYCREVIKFNVTERII